MIKDFMKYPLGFGKFDMQLFGADDGGAGGEGAPKFSGQFKEMMDPVSKQKVMVPVELETFFGHTISQTRNAVKDEYEGKYKPLLETLEKEAGEGSQAKAELEKLKLEGMTADQRAAEVIRQKTIEHESKVKNLSEEANSWKSMYETSKVTTDIINSFGEFSPKLCNSEHTMMLFQLEGGAKVAEIVGDDGKPTKKFETRVTLTLEDKDGKPEVVEGNPKELFKRWIQLERNSYQVLNTMSSGSGSKGGGANTGGRISAETIMGMNPAARIQYSREQGKK